jgi:hypothetical protein
MAPRNHLPESVVTSVQERLRNRISGLDNTP